jgi:6-pyruvoyl tetrahydropterin synthase/QueD family protein
LKISKRFRFEAAHRLPRYEGPCYHLHGHSYELHVTLEMPVDPETGMTVDFFRLEAAGEPDRGEHHPLDLAAAEARVSTNGGSQAVRNTRQLGDLPRRLNRGIR